MRQWQVTVALVLLAISTAAHPQTPPAVPKDAAKTANAPDPEEQARHDQLMQARDAIKAGRDADALPILDRVIAQYEARYPEGGKHRWFVARDTTETLAYMVMAASNIDKGADKRDASALAVWWGDALYMKGFALVDLGRKDEAKAQFERLVKLEPYHSQALSELGNLYQSGKDWPNALDYFTRAQEAAAFSPEAQKISDATRALRGQGFVLVELKRLDEAEAKYRKCLEMDPHDDKAKAELGYIDRLRASTH